MNRLIIIIVSFFAFIAPMKAQYVRVNIDYQTVAAMTAAYGTEAFAENYYNEQVGKILDRYRSAEVAAAAIYASKYLDRKALTNIGIWGDGTENYYYRRIYNLVGTKIMPKIWTVAGMMLHSPQTAIYWGSYLMKICDETKNLCYQFESVVTNASLSFKDLTFLCMNSEVARLLDLTKIGNVNWELMLDDLANIPGHFSKENLIADLDNLYSLAASVVSAGGSAALENLTQRSQFNDLFNGKISAIMDIMNNYERIYEGLRTNAGAELLNLVGGPENVGRLFDLSNYNATAWLTDYAANDPNAYYTQRYYIYWRDAGSQVLCDYNPPTDDNSILYGNEWYRFNTTDPNFYPNSSQVSAIKANSERYAGWGQAKVDQMNNAHDGNRYYIDYTRFGYILNRGGNQYGKAYAYSIKVTKSWDNKEEVYEEVFDSFTMDLNTFMRQLNLKLAEYNENDEGKTYMIDCDSRRYYTVADDAKLGGCESVIISATCHDGAELGSGTTQYKCKRCGSSLNAHSKSCAMHTSVSDNDLDTSDLDRQEREARQKISQLESRIRTLENENNRLLREIASADIETQAQLRIQYNANKTEIDRLKGELSTWQGKLNDILQAKEEAAADNDVQTDDYYRIPAIMAELQSGYRLNWTDAGTWNGYTFVRHATAANLTGVVTFQATLRIARKPKYFLGIKIHRAIMEISWKLTGEFSDSQVVDIIELNPSASTTEKQRLVNQHISQAASDYPGCDITTEYIKTDPTATDESNDTYHLLWASDRLDIAREVECRLTAIYADLVSLEKMMTYKLSIIDVLKGIAPYINDQAGRKGGIGTEAIGRWLTNAKSIGRRTAGGGTRPWQWRDDWQHRDDFSIDHEAIDRIR